MDLKDATLVLLSESAEYPAVASIAEAAYDQLFRVGAVDYRLLDELIGQASGKCVLRAIHRKYSPVAYEAVIMPILREIDRQAPVRPRMSQPSTPSGREDDPLTAKVWPPH
jgi:hypothetical protein